MNQIELFLSIFIIGGYVGILDLYKQLRELKQELKDMNKTNNK